MKYFVAFFAALSLALLALISMLGVEMVRHDMALDLVTACVEQNGASSLCAVTYDTNGIYLAISVGDTVVFCRDGYSQTC